VGEVDRQHHVERRRNVKENTRRAAVMVSTSGSRFLLGAVAVPDRVVVGRGEDVASRFVREASSAATMLG
jgi:hypothetical protein